MSEKVTPREAIASKNHVKGGVPVVEKENNVNNINREVFQYIISRGSIVGGII